MTDLDWMERKREAEYQPHQDTGYDHPEEIFFPEVLLPPVAKEEDYAFPVVREDNTIMEEILRRKKVNDLMAELNPTTWFGGKNE